MGKKRFLFSEPKRKKPAKKKEPSKTPKPAKEPDEIPKYVIGFLKTENEQKIYKALLKACHLYKNLSLRYRAEFHTTYDIFPKKYAEEKLQYYRKQMSDFDEKRHYRKKTPEERISELSASFDHMMFNLSIRIDIRASDIFKNYEAFTEKFDKIFEEYTKNDASTNVVVHVQQGVSGQQLRNFLSRMN